MRQLQCELSVHANACGKERETPRRAGFPVLQFGGTNMIRLLVAAAAVLATTLPSYAARIPIRYASVVEPYLFGAAAAMCVFMGAVWLLKPRGMAFAEVAPNRHLLDPVARTALYLVWVSGGIATLVLLYGMWLAA